MALVERPRTLQAQSSSRAPSDFGFASHDHPHSARAAAPAASSKLSQQAPRSSAVGGADVASASASNAAHQPMMDLAGPSRSSYAAPSESVAVAPPSSSHRDDDVVGAAAAASHASGGLAIDGAQPQQPHHHDHHHHHHTLLLSGYEHLAGSSDAVGGGGGAGTGTATALELHDMYADFPIDPALGATNDVVGGATAADISGGDVDADAGLIFPDLPASLLDQAPEYEYSSHTQGTVFDSAQDWRGEQEANAIYGLDEFDPSAPGFQPAAASDLSWGYEGAAAAVASATAAADAASANASADASFEDGLADACQPASQQRVSTAQSVPSSISSSSRPGSAENQSMHTSRPGSVGQMRPRTSASANVFLPPSAASREASEPPPPHSGLSGVAGTSTRGHATTASPASGGARKRLASVRDVVPSQGPAPPLNRLRMASWNDAASVTTTTAREPQDQLELNDAGLRAPERPQRASSYSSDAAGAGAQYAQPGAHAYAFQGDGGLELQGVMPPPHHGMMGQHSPPEFGHPHFMGLPPHPGMAVLPAGHPALAAAKDMVEALNSSMEAAMEAEGVAKCPYPNCDKTFAKNRAYNLRAHLRSHSHFKPFACAHCPRAFSRKHDLERHARVHSGDKPYICEACGRGFPRSDALRRHWRVERECGDKMSEIEAGQPLPSLPPSSTSVLAPAPVAIGSSTGGAPHAIHLFGPDSSAATMSLAPAPPPPGIVSNQGPPQPPATMHNSRPSPFAPGPLGPPPPPPSLSQHPQPPPHHHHHPHQQAHHAHHHQHHLTHAPQGGAAGGAWETYASESAAAAAAAASYERSAVGPTRSSRRSGAGFEPY